MHIGLFESCLVYFALSILFPATIATPSEEGIRARFDDSSASGEFLKLKPHGSETNTI
jgi:hypothetical protein